jgi:hypothetical protein
MKSERFIKPDGNYYYNEFGRLHREDGPALEHISGRKMWYYDGKKHRLDGPAVEYANGFLIWYINDEPMHCTSQEEFERLIKLKVFW